MTPRLLSYRYLVESKELELELCAEFSKLIRMGKVIECCGLWCVSVCCRCYLLSSFLLDLVDGPIARMLNQTSWLGSILDIICDNTGRSEKLFVLFPVSCVLCPVSCIWVFVEVWVWVCAIRCVYVFVYVCAHAHL